MVSADEHFDITLEVTRALAHTKPSGDDDDYQMIDYSGADVIKYSGTEKAYVRLFVFSLFLSSLFFLSFIADVFLFVSLSLLGAQTYRWGVSRLYDCVYQGEESYHGYAFRSLHFVCS